MLDELASRDYRVVREPGRRVVDQQTATGGKALPWVDMTAFLSRAFAVALNDHQTQSGREWVFFDRGLIDAASALQAIKGDPVMEMLRDKHRYHRRVFIAPPWPEIYVTDKDRRHSFNNAVAEYERLMRDYPMLGYEIVVLPKVSVDQRADFVLRTLAG